ncbi:hypothetical protein H839_05819 [Parageobacillus genomosp. 1]|jgi:hypothetical protein|uniref:DUF2569 domain-containing protein n=1 Tax=Parageobacillus genomosp. 1 TaxID=1295642 RepID=A0ABC9VI95_9BACL|nr:DUF2569 domain-containing protein [Parageobacillus genomosp. 1]EZP78232.1 hypothetical protein H839_05819 [Parageobacillus genomosp. 1]
MSKKEILQGIRDWLILIAVGVVFAPVFQLFKVAFYYDILTTQTWAFYTDPTAPFYQPILKPLLYLQVFGNVSLLILSIVVMVHFFKKKETLPKMLVTFFSSNFLLGSIGYYMVTLIPQDTPIEQIARLKSAEEIVIMGIMCIIWIPYLLVSKRVKNTFMN